jgi:hypothetical protein
LRTFLTYKEPFYEKSIYEHVSEWRKQDRQYSQRTCDRRCEAGSGKKRKSNNQSLDRRDAATRCRATEKEKSAEITDATSYAIKASA